MSKKIITFISILSLLLITTSVFAAEKPAAVSRPVFITLNVEGIIDAATADYVIKAIELAQKENSSGVLLNMQTPGGLDKSMRKICEKILTSSVPVITYITPKGSRAASAGTFILLSSHVAAMAEGTNIGTAHPVDYQGKTSSAKITNDSIAYIKDLARLNGRNEKWAEEAITKNISSSEITALKEKVIDVTAKDTDELMKKIDGFRVKVNGREKTIITKDYELKAIGMSQKHKFLHYLSDPNIVYVLFILGLIGLIYEIANAGSVVFPGVAGVICLSFAFIGFDSLPINSAGLVLIALAAILFFVEMVNPTYGMLGIAGFISMGFGSILLFPSRALGEDWGASYVLMTVMVLLLAAFCVVVVSAVVKAMKKKSITGVQTLIGLKGVVSSEITEVGGVVNVAAEDWQAQADEKIAAREVVEVLEVNGNKLKVKRIPRKV